MNDGFPAERSFISNLAGNILKRRSSAAKTISAAALFVLAGMVGHAGQAVAAPVPISVTAGSWNIDGVVEDRSAWSAVEFNGLGGAGNTWMETIGGTVAMPTESTAGTGVAWTSQITNTVTGGNSQFFFQPYGTSTGGTFNNILDILHGNTGSLTFSTSTNAYSNLSILASTTSGTSSANSDATLTINFSGGGTASGIAYNEANWTTVTGGVNANTTGWALADTTATSGSQPGVPLHGGVSVYLFETDINLTQFSVVGGPNNGANASTVPIASITFGGTASSGGTTGIFAVSGTPAPEPASASLLGIVASALLMRRRRKR